MKKILVIEDDTLMLRTIELILKKQGYIVDLAANGKDAMTALTGNHYDLVITDIMLPFANGFELVSKIKNSSTNTNVPVIIISAITHESSITDGFELGVDDYLRKPFVPSELVLRVNRLIEKTAV
ncbi:response regulator receiver domain-containing protein [Chitinophaga skermanii]|uniref:Response regulator receiver domain-containing protein n=1 Tax=Chitinophaga skermanii TaxID=331697 RepID=A0A327QXG4_9BACT|nr:response regulator transcription factor [Chitinophaga skermanii]RAJ08488.1 response regulator receiver domain-containing protein [Chitinophaga skermanii]